VSAALTPRKKNNNTGGMETVRIDNKTLTQTPRLKYKNE